MERLIEAFAFLAARIHLKLDDDFPEITEALLNIVYPHFVRPVPSMAIADFQVDIEHGKLTTGLKIERNTTLYSRPVGGAPCKFRTCYETTLWPVSVTAAEWKTPDLLKPAAQGARRHARAPAGDALRARCTLARTWGWTVSVFTSPGEAMWSTRSTSSCAPG